MALHVLDVDEGQAVLIHKNGRGILIDTGHAGQAENILVQLRKQKVDTLDYLFLTHLHPDHASGYFRLNEAFPDTEVLDNCHPIQAGTPDIIRWVNQALKENPKHRCIKSGDTLHWHDMKLEILWPEITPQAGDGLNHMSLVMQLTYRQKKILIMGDADQATESAILDSHSLSSVDVIVIGHHGARDASSEVWLNTIKPHIAVISVNKHNIRGYPAKETLERIKKATEKLHITSEDGEFIYRLD